MLKGGIVKNLKVIQDVTDPSLKIPLMKGHAFLIKSNQNTSIYPDSIENSLLSNFQNSFGNIDNCIITGDITDFSGGICAKYAGNNGTLKILGLHHLAEGMYVLSMEGIPIIRLIKLGF
jgi:hypothetical protein